jgi:hypothetical protein
METTEHFAQVALVTELLGKQVLLSGGDVAKLASARTRYAAGAKASQASAAGAVPCPTESVTLTRRELEALIDEGVRRDRGRR